MRVREYILMRECVEHGIAAGWTRAHKHTDTPDDAQMWAAIRDEVMLAITDYFVLDDIDDE